MKLFILTEKHQLEPSQNTNSKTMSESQSILRMGYANDTPNNHTKNSRLIITDQAEKDEFIIYGYAMTVSTKVGNKLGSSYASVIKM